MLSEKRQVKIEIRKRAENSITKLGTYIALEGYPPTAEKYIIKLYEFIIQVAKHPLAYSICRKQTWAKRNYRCAVFDSQYIIPYQTKSNAIIIVNVIHGARLK